MGDEQRSRPGPADGPGRDDRSETLTERMDRNWDELMQELRVTQTGAQILVGFLLTVPFQSRFGDLDAYQRALYLVLVVLAVVATVLIVAPVSLHRLLFRQHLKATLVASADRLARAGLTVLALVLAGVPMLLFDVVVSRAAGLAVGACAVVALLLAWVVLPLSVARRSRGGRRPV